MAQIHHLTCPICQRQFVVKFDSVVIGRKRTYCSQLCKDRKTPLDEFYFETLTEESLHTLGQIVATSFIRDFQTIIVKSDTVTLEKIQKALKSTYPILRSDFGLSLIKINSKRLVNKFTELGISNS